MKYIALLLLALAFTAGCVTTQHTYNDDNWEVYATEHEGGDIIDEEYDLLVAPKYDYQSNPSYEQQIKTVPAAKSTARKLNTKPKAYKK